MELGVNDWPSVALKEVAELCLGKMLDAKKNKGRLLPYLANPNVRWLEVDTRSLKLMPFEDHEEERYGLRAGDVVVCEGGEAGRAAVWDGRIPGLKFQKAIHRVRPKPPLNAAFLVYRLMHDYRSGRLADYYTGATIKHLTGQDLARYRFPLPPVQVQLRTVAILDKVNSLRSKRRAALAALDLLVQSIFMETFGDPVTNPKGWRKLQLGKIFNIARGGSPRPIDDYITDDPLGVNWVMIGDTEQGGKYITSTKKRIRAEGVKRSRMVNSGDFLLTNSMSFGRPYILKTSGCIHDGWLVLSPQIDDFDANYFYSLLSSNAVFSEFSRRAAGATVKNLNIDLVSGVEVAVPPLEKQKEFARAVKLIEAHKERAQRGASELSALFESLQVEAFPGAL